MKNSILFMLFFASSLMLTGCGKSAVECDNGDAKELVMEIVEEEMKKQLIALFESGRGGWTQKTAENYNSGGKHTDLYPDEDTAEKIYAGEAGRFYLEWNPKLTNIRTDSVDNEVEKSECSAEVSMENGKKIDINYVLSTTTDGKLYAEVSGL